MKRLAVALLLVVSGCALTSNAPPLDVHYFSVDVPATTRTTSARVGATQLVALAIGRVRSSEFLRNRIVHRNADETLGAYEQWRWTEYPEAYLRRSLSHVLFDDQRFEQSLGRDVPTLDVELIAFEEARRGNVRTGRVTVDYRLRVGDRVLASDVVTAEHEAPAGRGMAPVVDAVEAALAEVTARIGAAVDATLTRSSANAASAAPDPRQ